MQINWNEIGTYNGSQNSAFEELVCQLARAEIIPNKKSFYRISAPDGGVEAYCVLENGDEFGWQAKYFSKIESSQWAQIKNSLFTAIAKHPALTDYYVCIPLDRPDPRTKSKSLMEKWNSHVATWKSEAKALGRDIEIHYWGSSELIERLGRPENYGKIRFWFGKDELTASWFQRKSAEAISALGNRYLPRHNFELDIRKNFDALKFNKKYKLHAKEILHEFLIDTEALTQDNLAKRTDANNAITSLKEIRLKIRAAIERHVAFELPLDEENCLKNLLADFYKKIEVIEKGAEAADGKKVDEYNYFRHCVSKAHSGCVSLGSLLEGRLLHLACSPVLFLYGEAGKGKSHMLADIFSKDIAKKRCGLLILGQHLNERTPPWTQILNQILRTTLNESDLLGALNALGEASGQRVLFVIDAINEGAGRYFWPNHIKSFVESFQRYPWVALVISVRDSYKKMLVDDPLNDFNYPSLRHTGFEGVEHEASLFFFSEFGLEAPSIPLMHPEFSNPLFLVLLCKGLVSTGNTKVPKGFRGITAVFNNFIQGAENNISDPNRLDYSSAHRLVRKVLDLLTERKIQRKTTYLSLSEAHEIGVRASKDYTGQYLRFIDELISEGVLSKNIIYRAGNDPEEIVYFAYERLDDFETAKFLLTNLVDADSLNDSLKNGGVLGFYIGNSGANQGLIDAFSTLIPELYGKELYELLGEEIMPEVISRSFLESLLWRSVGSIDVGLQKRYVTEVVENNPYLLSELIDKLYSLAGDNEHPYNADYLHSKLNFHSLPDRDQFWVPYLDCADSNDHPLQRLISWANKHSSAAPISIESRVLVGTALCWALASTNIKLRDEATFALVELLLNRMDAALKLIEKFRDVNDPYIYERLLLAVYGAVQRSSCLEYLSDICIFLLESVFEGNEIYPNVMIRDSARNIVAFAGFKRVVSLAMVKAASPPYRSAFPSTLPSNADIDKYSYDYRSPQFKDFQWGANSIIQSMTTEYGRGIGRYGDFGRYTFQSKVSRWNFPAQELSNYACKLIFEKFGYDPELHGRFDRNANRGSRLQNKIERIGKKYQWLALYEVVARLADNHLMLSEGSRYGNDAQYTTWYDGTWEPFLRNLDPSYNFYPGNESNLLPGGLTGTDLEPDWSGSNKEWAANEHQIIEPKLLIEQSDSNGQEWIALESMLSWDEDSAPGEDSFNSAKKHCWYILRGYFVESKYERKVREFLAKKDGFGGMGSWLPQPYENYHLYSREYFWSPGHEFFKDDSYYGAEEWSELRLGDWSCKDSVPVMTATQSYFWEGGLNHRELKSYSMPRDLMFRTLDLKYSPYSGIFLESNGKVACFDAAILNGKSTQFVIRKDLLDAFIKKTGLKLFWACTGEKSIHCMNTTKDTGWVEVSAQYWYTRSQVVGQHTTRII